MLLVHIYVCGISFSEPSHPARCFMDSLKIFANIQVFDLLPVLAFIVQGLIGKIDHGQLGGKPCMLSYHFACLHRLSADNVYRDARSEPSTLSLPAFGQFLFLFCGILIKASHWLDFIAFGTMLGKLHFHPVGTTVWYRKCVSGTACETHDWIWMFLPFTLCSFSFGAADPWSRLGLCDGTVKESIL